MTRPRNVGAGPRMSTRADRLVAAARQAGAVRAYQTDPDVVALRVERVRGWSSRLIWVGIILGLAFTMANVQQFAAQGAQAGSLPWLIAWLLDPMVSLVLVGILLAEQVTARYQVAMGRWPRIAKWGALAATYTMNTWQAWAAGNAALIVLHSVPPLMVFVAVEAFPVVRDRLTEAVLVAERDARRRGRVEVDPAVTVDTDVAADSGSRTAGEVAQPEDATAGRNLVAHGGATFSTKVAQPGGRNRTRNPRGATQLMRSHWDAELAEGRIPSGGELARVGGVSGQYARKVRADWVTGVAQPDGRNQGATSPDRSRDQVAQPGGGNQSATAPSGGRNQVAQPHGATSWGRVAQPDGATNDGEVAQPDRSEVAQPTRPRVAQPNQSEVAPSANGQR